MILQIYIDPVTKKRKFVLEIREVEMQSMKLTDFDRALMKDVDNGPHSSIADKLLVLEMWARRIKEALPNSEGAI